MYFWIEDDDSLEKYNTIWDRVSADIKKDLKTKIKPYGDKATDFYDKKIPEVGSNHICLAVIILYSALRKDEIYYP